MTALASTCRTCDGRGTVIALRGGPVGKPIEFRQRCPRCKGVGRTAAMAPAILAALLASCTAWHMLTRIGQGFGLW